MLLSLVSLWVTRSGTGAVGQPVHDAGVLVFVGEEEVDLRLAGFGAAHLVGFQRSLEVAEAARRVVEVGDGLGQLGGVEAGQEVLELAERGAGLAEHVGVGDEVVGDGAFDELVYPPGARPTSSFSM